MGLVLLGGYLGGVGSNDLELNPVQWDWSAPSTYLSIGMGMAAGALGGYGLLNPGTVTYTASLLTPFGQVGLSGFQNNWNFQWTTTAGGSGEIPLNNQDPIYSPAYQVSKGISNMYRPGDPQFYQGTMNEAKDLLIASSKYNNTEMGMYYFNEYGYYFEESYGYLNVPFYAGDPSSDFWSYSHFDGYYKYYYGENQFQHSYTYSLNPYRYEVYIPNGLHPRQNIGRPDAYYHTHPNSTYLSTSDINNMERRGFPTWAVGWDGVIRGIQKVFHFLLPGVEIRR